MKVYFVRHGESEGNEKGLHQAPETSLSEKGKKQAEILAERLKKLPIDFIYSSNQKRAVATAEIIAGQLKKPIEYWKDLAEMRMPSAIWNRPTDEPEVVKIKEAIKKNFPKGNWKYSDEETFEELNARTQRVLEHLLFNQEGQSVLCISHASIIKAILAKMIFAETLTPEIFLGFRYHLWSENTGITVCEYTDKWGWGVLTWNDSSHL